MKSGSESAPGRRQQKSGSLRIENVNFSVSKHVCKVDGKLTAAPPKTANSVRKIALSEETIKLLDKQRETNKEKYPGSPYIRISSPPR